MDSEQTNKEWRKGMEEYERERRRMNGMEKDAKQRAVIAGLTEDFVCLNYVDLTTDAYENTTIFRISDTLAAIIPGWATERNSQERFRLFSQYAVYEPDRERFIERTNQSLVLLHLQKNPAYFVNFRIRNGEDFSYTQMKFTADYAADRSIKGLVVGIHSIDEEMRLEAQHAEQLVVIEGLTEDFGCVNYVDLTTDAYANTTIYRVSDALSAIIPGWREERNFLKRLQLFTEHAVYEPDREKFIERAGKEVVLNHLKTDPAYFVNFRWRIGDDVSYTQMKFTADYAADRSIKGLVVGIHSIDEEMRLEAQHAEQLVVIEGLTEDFGCVNYVDLTTDAYANTTIYRVSDALSAIIPGWREERNFLKRLQLFTEHAVYEPDREKFIERAGKEVVLNHLKTDPAYFVNFRWRIGDDVSYSQIKFTADYAADRSIKGLVIGIHSIDEVKRGEMQRAEYMAVIASLADDFEFVGIIDKKNDELTIYRTSASLEKALNVFEGEKIGYTVFKQQLEQMVVEEDRKELLVRDGRDVIAEALMKDPVYKFEERLMIDGQVQYYRIKFTQDQDDPDKLVFGLLNIDQQVRNEIAIGELEKELEYQNELKEARDRAEAASRAKSAFLFNMSHDVRTPMNAIIGFTDIAQKHIHDIDKVADSLQKIKNAGMHLLSLLNDVLDMSRVESGHVEITEEPADLLEIMDGIAPIVSPLAMAKNIDYKTVYDGIRDRRVRADILHINQVVINLLTNAVKYTAEGGMVTLRLEQEEDMKDGVCMYSIIVEDTGIGMSKEFMAGMFESFVRENREEVMKESGVGLGLAITKRLVTLMNGTITVASELGNGSVFTVKLPLKIQSEDEAETREEEVIHEPKSLEGKKILLVDDNELNREIAVEILEDSGMVVDMACNGMEAVEMVKQNGMRFYDAILMDIQMPVMNGYEATEAIRALPDDGKPVVIIALSANAFEEDKRKSLSVGMNAHIPKPVNAAELVETLRKYIHG